MRNAYPFAHQASMNYFATLTAWMFFLIVATNSTLFAQIFEPEGLNMPGAYNGFANPGPNVKFGNAYQVAGGQLNVHPSLLGQRIWQTTFSAAASGGNIVGGNHDYLFTSDLPALPTAINGAALPLQRLTPSAMCLLARVSQTIIVRLLMGVGTP